MSKLSINETIGSVVTRQTLYNIWATASLGKITGDDLSPEIQDIGMGTNFSDADLTPKPGRLFYHQLDQIMYCFTDELDVMDNGVATGVSLWLAVGPDRFETACLAYEPIPAGAVVEPVMDRWVRCMRTDVNPIGDTNTPLAIGVNQSGLPDDINPYAEGQTAESGTWIRVAIDGIMRAWFPSPSIASGASLTWFTVTPQNSVADWIGVVPTYTGVYGAVGGRGNTRLLAGGDTIGNTLHRVTVASGYTAGYFPIRWCGITGKYE